jgi:uncharacterized protein (TIGR03437 family)
MQLTSNNFFRFVVMALAALMLLSVGAMAQSAPVEWQGFINTLPGPANFVGEWTVNNRKVTVTNTTVLKQERAKIEVGAYVEVKGTAPAGATTTIAATSIQVKYRAGVGVPVEIKGTVESLPTMTGRIGEWKISGKLIKVTSSTRLVTTGNGQFAIGSMVEGTGLQMADGTITATLLVLKPETPPVLPVKFSGVIEKLPTAEGRIGEWTISGRKVGVNAQTEIVSDKAPVAVGTHVDVEGTLSQGMILATKIETKPTPPAPPMRVIFRGKIEKLPMTTGLVGDWTVSGRTVTVSAQTVIKPNVAAAKVGLLVVVYGTSNGNGPVAASLLEIKSELESDPNYVHFFGTIKALPSAANLQGEWKVDDKTVVVSTTTKLIQDKANAIVGGFVEVEGLKQADGKINAAEVEVLRGNILGVVRYVGVIETLPTTTTKAGNWTVSKRTIVVSDKTEINEEKGKAVVGAHVLVVGNLRTDGVIEAIEIVVKTDSPVPAFFSFTGKIVSLPDGMAKPGAWKVGERVVHVTDKTRIHQERGRAIVDATVEVKGTLRADGSVDATSIEVKPAAPTPPQWVEFSGKVVSLPNSEKLVGDWKVDDKTVRVSPRTFIKRERETLKVGSMVKVKGVQAAGGVVEAAYIEVVPTATAADFESFPAVASVSASSYDTEVAPNSIAAAFGLNLARTTRGASTLPLPTELDGVCVTVDGIPAGLFFVSPGQINYLVPEGLQPGTAMVTVEINDEVIAQGELTIIENKPGFFTANASGSGAPAGALLRIASNGRQSYEPLARVEGNQVVAAPIKRNAGDALFLVLYGTGLAANLDDIEVTLNGTPARVLYAGAAPGFAGLNQLNLQLPENLPSGNLVISIKINDGDGTMLTGNAVTINVQ